MHQAQRITLSPTIAVHNICNGKLPKLQNIWQINLRKSFLANAQLENDALLQANRPIIVITEPYCYGGKAVFTSKGYTTFSIKTPGGPNPRAAIAVPNTIRAFLKTGLSNRDTVTLIINNSTKNRTLCLVSAYLDIELDSPVVGQIIQNTVTESDRSNWDLLIASDSNAHSTLCGSKKQNKRGCKVEEFIATNDLVLINSGNKFTFVNSMASTIIDITIANRKLEPYITDWVVTDKKTFSDHKCIEFKLDFESSSTIETRNYRKGNWELYGSILTRKTKDLKLDPNLIWDGHRLDLAAKMIENSINHALDKTCPKKSITVGADKPGSPEWFQPETRKLSKITKKNWINCCGKSLQLKIEHVITLLNINYNLIFAPTSANAGKLFVQALET
jgi:hypothetical protein